MKKPNSALRNSKTRTLDLGLILLATYTFFRFGIDVILPGGLIPNDFMVFYVNVDRYLQDKLFYIDGDTSPFKYSPTFLIFFRWTFFVLQKHLGWLAWCLLSVVGFAWGTRTIWRICLEEQWTSHSPKALSPAKLAAILASFTIFGWHGYIEQFSYGQGDYLVFSAFLGSVVCSWRAQTRWLSVVLMSLLLISKPQGAIFLSYFFILRQWQLLASMALTTFVLHFVPLLFWDLGQFSYAMTHWKVILSKQSVEFLSGNLNQSLAASLARLFDLRPWVFRMTQFSLALGALSILSLTWFWKNAKTASVALRLRLACLVLVFYPLVSPLGWRWFTFIWIPIGATTAVDYFRLRNTSFAKTSEHRLMGACLLIFALNGIFLQKLVAHRLGVEEVDNLSWAGLYCLGNVLLFTATAISFKQKTRTI